MESNAGKKSIFRARSNPLSGWIQYSSVKERQSCLRHKKPLGRLNVISQAGNVIRRNGFLRLPRTGSNNNDTDKISQDIYLSRSALIRVAISLSLTVS